jgi:hypothetical protein
MNYLVIYPGRFHPFHRGHMASYDWLANKFGADSVYIATSNVQAPITSPFNYSDKVMMMTKLGVPASHIANVKDPYKSVEITGNLSDEEKKKTALVFAVSAKDAERFNFAPKKDGSPGYLQPLPKTGKGVKPMTKHGYVAITPTINFQVNGIDANSASEIRSMYIKGNDHDKDQVIADLYGQPDPAIRAVFDKKLGISEQIQQHINEARHSVVSGRQFGKIQLAEWMQNVLQLEKQANSIDLDFSHINPDYIDEKTYNR